jgi:endothelin-converting enzyme/putative endopeptidase
MNTPLPFRFRHSRLALALIMLALGPAATALAADPPGTADTPTAVDSGATVDSGGLDHAMLDTKTPPCENFYRFACGGWLDANPIPPDQASWGIDQAMAERDHDMLRGILEKAAAAATPETRKIGDYYAACMDEARIESLGIAPIQPLLGRVDALTDKDQLPALIADLHGIGIGVFFSFGSGQDAKDATSEIAIADEGGMGLPDRDYYLKTDPDSQAMRTDYVAHIAKMLGLAGEPDAKAIADAEAILGLEMGLANGALDIVARRDPSRTYHLLDRPQLDQLTPGFSWTTYLAGIGAPPVKAIDVTETAFLNTEAKLIASTDIEDIKAYLRYHIISAAAPWLPRPFVEENFAFYRKRLTGATEIRPRWKRCVDAVDEALGEDLGRAYVAIAFPPEAKARTEAMVAAISNAFAADLREVDWMSPETRAKAIAKLGMMRKKIGYPDHWRDYGALDVRRDDMLGNDQRASSFEVKREMDKIGKPVDRGEWLMTPPTVNAYYDPQMNDINLAAGMLQPPVFSDHYDDAINYGATGGGTVGHEMTHGFDDEGRQYDGHGNLIDWWTPEDAAKFQQRAQCVVDQYSGYTAVGDLRVNGQLTLGENVADLGGVRLGYIALMKILADKARTAAGGSTQPATGGFSPAQRYFIAYAQSWCTAERPEALRLQAQTDPHSPPEYRVNGVVSDMPEFRAAFACEANAPMVRAKACRVW